MANQQPPPASPIPVPTMSTMAAPGRSAANGWPRLFSRTRRRRLLKTLMKSHRLKLNKIQELPLRIRPWFVGLTAFVLVTLGILGLHPTAQGHVPLPDKALHFLGFGVATICTFFIWDVDESARRIWWWRWSATILTGFTCLIVGGIFSEVIQGLLPYKVFQWGDIVANELGASLGLVTARHLEKKYRDARELSELYLPVTLDDDDDPLHSTSSASSTEDLLDRPDASTGARSGGGVARQGKAGSGYVPSKGRKSRLADVWNADIEGDELFSLGEVDEETEFSAAHDGRA